MSSYDNRPLHETRRSLPPLQVQSLAWPLAYVAAQSLDCLYIKHVVGPATSSVRPAHLRRACAPACQHRRDRASPAMRLR
jgi:hypothetical protein